MSEKLQTQTENITTGPGTAPDDDSLIMLEVADDSEHALRMLIEKWKKPLINYFYRSLPDAFAAEDLAQQTFINLYKARKSYTPKAKFSTYIFHIARHVLINEHRKSSRRPADATDPSEMNAPVSGRDELDKSELEEVFYCALESMPENQRTAILMLKQQELSYEEIAQLMDAKVSAVKTWIHRARQTLKETLEGCKI